MKKQRVIRTLSNNYANPTKRLTEALEDGWTVVMCNTTCFDNNCTCLEYIVEKENEN